MALQEDDWEKTIGFMLVLDLEILWRCFELKLGRCDIQHDTLYPKVRQPLGLNCKQIQRNLETMRSICSTVLATRTV
jgi:hypothetical protein